MIAVPKLGRRIVRLWMGVSLLALAGGCGGAPAAAPAAAKSVPAPAAAQAAPLQRASLLLDWTVQGYHAPFYEALAKGYYKAQGIDLTIQAGKGSPVTGEVVANGQDTFGIVDAAVLMGLVSKGIQEKMVFGILQKSPNAVIVRRGTGIRTPKDLIGKPVGFTPGEAPYIILPAFLKANGIQPSQLHMVAAAFAPKYKGLVSGRLDAMTGYTYTAAPLLEGMGLKSGIRTFAYSDYGVNVPSLGIVVSDRTAAQDGSLIRRFLTATAEGYRAAEADPAGAIALLLKANPGQGLNATAQQQVLQGSLQLLATKNTQGHPLGWMSPLDWQSAQSLLVKYQGLKPAADVSQYFTDQFVSAGS